MNGSTGVGYVYNYYSRSYAVNYFFRGIRYFNPSRKYFSTTLITSMSSAIHQILLKKKSTKTVRSCWPLTFGPIDRCAAILASLLISFQIESCTMLCWLADDRNLHLEEIVSNIEIINKRIFSVAGRIFKPDRCRSIVKDLKPWCLSTVTKILNNDHFCLINI